MKFFKKNLKFILGIAFIIFLAIIYLNNFSNSSKYKTYQSSNLSFSTKALPGFKTEDTGITFIMKNHLGEVTVIRNGTQFSNLRDYLNEQDKASNIQIISSRIEEVNDHESVVRIENILNKKNKIYYIYMNNNVYILSTSSPELYDELDQIANSFKYTGD